MKQKRIGRGVLLAIGVIALGQPLFVGYVLLQRKRGLRFGDALQVAASLILLLVFLSMVQEAAHQRRYGLDGPPFWLARIRDEFLAGPWQRFANSVWKDVALVAIGVIGVAGWAAISWQAGWPARWLVMGVLFGGPMSVVAGFGVRGLLARRSGEAGPADDGADE